MSESKHTPGPWKVIRHSHINKEQWLSILNGAWDITHNGGSNPAIVACSKYSAMTPEENIANACLIAAAPDLLEACKEAAETLEACLSEEDDPKYKGFNLDNIVATAQLCRTVIAEAEKGDKDGQIRR